MSLCLKEKASAVVKAAAVLCDVVAMPFRAVVHDWRAGYNENPTAHRLVRVKDAVVRNFFMLTFPFAPIVACHVADKVVPVTEESPLLTVIKVAGVLFCVYGVAWEHPFVPLERQNWERFPLTRKWDERTCRMSTATCDV